MAGWGSYAIVGESLEKLVNPYLKYFDTGDFRQALVKGKVKNRKGTLIYFFNKILFFNTYLHVTKINIKNVKSFFLELSPQYQVIFDRIYNATTQDMFPGLEEFLSPEGWKCLH